MQLNGQATDLLAFSAHMQVIIHLCALPLLQQNHSKAVRGHRRFPGLLQKPQELSGVGWRGEVWSVLS